ncbi:MAG TPA: TerC family protein [Chloroflexia bacterium]
MDTLTIWIVFNIFVLVMLALDLGVFHKSDHAISVKESLIWSGIWVLVAIAFNAGVFYFSGAEKGLEFFTGYVIERSLSIDNIFVFILMFSYFGVPAKFQYKVLFWGILGALLMRGALILVGTALIKAFEWILYVFGAILILSAIRMALQKDDDAVQPDRNPVVRLFRRFFPVTESYHGGSFFVRQGAKRLATPLFIVLLVVETTDLVFALDSIPAIFAITTDPFIVYTSNVFAILGLRALYFALAGIMDRFHYLKLGLSVVLGFVGAKMLLEAVVHIETWVSLVVVASVLTIAVVASLLRPPDKHLAEIIRQPDEAPEEIGAAR